MNTRPSNDITRRGNRTATPEQIETVKNALLDHIGEENLISGKLLESRIGIPGRVVRAAIHELEKHGELLTGGGDGGIFVAQYQEEVEKKTRRDRAAAMSILERCEWREKFMQNLPRKQDGLFS